MRPTSDFEIPGTTDDKYFYVWVDAPGRLHAASFKELCEREGLNWDDWWGPDSKAELYHFIGKDIVYFHTLFWPAMLMGAGLRIRPPPFTRMGSSPWTAPRCPNRRGTFISARTYLDHLQPDYLRYYFAAKLGSGMADIDLNLDDFVARVNSDLVGKLVNIASRCAGFINKQLRRHAQRRRWMILRRISTGISLRQRQAIGADFEGSQLPVGHSAESWRWLTKPIATSTKNKPWHPDQGRRPTATRVHRICTQGINLFRVLITLLGAGHSRSRR